VFFYQSFEKIRGALDWRETKVEDLVSAVQLIDEAWTKVVAYLRDAWSGRLLPWVCELRLPIPQLPRPSVNSNRLCSDSRSPKLFSCTLAILWRAFARECGDTALRQLMKLKIRLQTNTTNES